MKIIKIRRPGIYKMRQEMSEEAGRYMTINECIDKIRDDTVPWLISTECHLSHKTIPNL